MSDSIGDEEEVRRIFESVDPKQLLRKYATSCGVSLDQEVLDAITAKPKVIPGRVRAEVYIEYSLPQGVAPRGIDPQAFADWLKGATEGVGMVGDIPIPCP